MMHLVMTSFLGLAVLQLTLKIFAWRKAYLAAKATGFPVYLSPVHMYDMWFLIFYFSIAPWLDRLPESWTTPWLQMVQNWNIWKFGYKPFEDVGSNTFVLASPGGNMLWTCDPHVCKQLEIQHPSSQVDVEALKFFQLYGPNIGSVEGDEWKKHRQVIMTGFNPATNAAVWNETTVQVQQLIQRWSEDDYAVQMARDWTSRLALHVICSVFFRKTMKFRDYKEDDRREVLPEGHRMPFDQAIFTVVENIRFLFMIPRALLPILPSENMRKLHLAFTEWNMYLNELCEDAKSNLDRVAAKRSKSITESIIIAGTTGSDKTGIKPLPSDSVLGNLFFMLMAGHETTGNTMAFILYLLAIYPEYQTKIQEDLDLALVERHRSEWSVEKEYQSFQQGWIGAVIKEVLRLYCVVQYTGRKIVAPIHVADSDGKHHTIPVGTACLLGFAAAFKNPNTWTQNPASHSRRADLHDSPALDFNPGRWLRPNNATDSKEPKKDSMESRPENKVLEHFPFGQGPHVCPGRLFAQVKMTAMVATIFVDYKVELIVDEKTRCSSSDSQEAWEKTRDHALRMMVDDIDFNLSIMLRKPLPIRLVPRP